MAFESSCRVVLGVCSRPAFVFMPELNDSTRDHIVCVGPLVLFYTRLSFF
jgi:hypothetical protein